MAHSTKSKACLMLLSLWLDISLFENCGIEIVVKYFQQVEGVPLRSETFLIVGAWYFMELDWVLPIR
jgi:hypothetical protein